MGRKMASGKSKKGVVFLRVLIQFHPSLLQCKILYPWRFSLQNELHR